MKFKNISLFLALILCLTFVAAPVQASKVPDLGQSFPMAADNKKDADSIHESIAEVFKNNNSMDTATIARYKLGTGKTIFNGEVNYSSEHSSSIMPIPSSSEKTSLAEENSPILDSGEVNHPPIADLQYLILNPESLKDNQVTKETQIAWLYSFDGTDFTYDPDGDTITGMYIGGIPQNAIIGELPGQGFVTQFSEPGTYTLLFQAEDEHGALSEIWGMNIRVVAYSAINNLKINYTIGSDVTNTVYFGEKGYLNYYESISMNGDPDYIYDSLISTSWPAGHSNMLLKNNIKISGTINNPDGSPKVNERVIIGIPLTYNRSIYEDIKTDSQGAFSINKYVGKDVYNNEADYTTGDFTGRQAKYCYMHKGGEQRFYYPTELLIACNSQLYQQDVTVEVGRISSYLILGDRWIWTHNISGGDPVLRWREI